MTQPTIEELTQAVLDRAGDFRGYPLSWYLEESTKADSKSVAVVIRFAISQQWDSEAKTWIDYTPGWYCDARVWIVGKDGNLNGKAVDALKKTGVWDGNFDAFDAGGAPTCVYCLLTVELNQWEGGSGHRIEWVNPDAPEPMKRGGAFKPTDGGLLAKMRQRFQGATSARGGVATTGAPPAPATAASAPRPAGGAYRDGWRIEVSANVGSLEEVQQAFVFRSSEC